MIGHPRYSQKMLKTRKEQAANNTLSQHSLTMEDLPNVAASIAPLPLSFTSCTVGWSDVRIELDYLGRHQKTLQRKCKSCRMLQIPMLSAGFPPSRAWSMEVLLRFERSEFLSCSLASAVCVWRSRALLQSDSQVCWNPLDPLASQNMWFSYAFK